jgi:hypothetical protein
MNDVMTSLHHDVKVDSSNHLKEFSVFNKSTQFPLYSQRRKPYGLEGDG